MLDLDLDTIVSSNNTANNNNQRKHVILIIDGIIVKGWFTI